MPTPTFKLLLNALRLGQPQEPQAAIFALVEALAAQDDTIDELRRKLQVVQSATQILETKAARLEMDLEAMRGGAGGESQHAAPVAPQPAARQPSQRPPPMAPAPQQQPHSSRLQQQLHQAEGYGPSMQMQRSLNETQEAPAAQQQPLQQPQHQPRSASARPPPPRIPSDHPPPQQAPGPDAHAPVFPRAAALPREPLVAEESSHDDFKVETMVVHKKDLEFLKNPDAPFRLPPPGQRAAPDRGSIPGAPWARGAARPAERFPAAPKADPRPAPPPAPMMDEFTAEAAPQHQFRGDEGDDETYRDGGGIASLAAALGLAADDPRIQKLRSNRSEPPTHEGRAADVAHERPHGDSVSDRRATDSVPPPKR